MGAWQTKPDFAYRRFDAPLGGEIVGLDLSKPLSDDTFTAIRNAFLESQVLVFRNQHDLTPEQHVAFSRRFGELQIHVLKEFHLPGHPEILVVSNVVENGRKIGLGDAGRYWHSDLSYVAEPSLGSLLHAQELPEEEGDTIFANMYLAYEELPKEIKQRIASRRAIHSYTLKYDALRALSNARNPLTEEQKAQVPPQSHPVVRTHPETGRKALFVSEGFTARIEGIPEAESEELLKYLFSHSTQPAFTYRHRWEPGDLVFWDNRCTIHLATGCPPGQRRTLYRTTVKGDVPY
ncbi:TauD/TfdA family dioxygenase [uncultured Ferrovibrio sp.]|jgi:Probable taurine catabolism dioxygenase|uniref:TauD/TfdA dioxygenase family protein n=1 Tax=uncultured Ferrovibrio sp. TaxID=1576913 RepID=UPI00261BB1C7|nr:TauD/TfdA family dioxygenase [uncultured Ferrovibrio sp.]